MVAGTMPPSMSAEDKRDLAMKFREGRWITTGRIAVRPGILGFAVFVVEEQKMELQRCLDSGRPATWRRSSRWRRAKWQETSAKLEPWETGK